jgi:hypothetical protein
MMSNHTERGMVAELDAFRELMPHALMDGFVFFLCVPRMFSLADGMIHMAATLKMTSRPNSARFGI